MIKGVAEYLDVDLQTDLLLDLYEKVKGRNVGKDFNVFGKTPFESYSLEYNMSGKPTGYEKVFDPILSQHRKVHPHYQFRSTGFNTATSTEKDVFPHTDIDEDTEYSQGYNIVIPVLGNSRIDYYETREEEVYLPEKNAHGYAYYHEFKAQAYTEDLQATPRFEKFLAERKIGEIIVDKPILIETEIMHRVVITEAPRCAWVTRWNNIPPEWTFEKWKDRVESML
jgi:hypothetical protein